MVLITDEFAERRGAGIVSLVEQDVLDQWQRYQKVREHRSLYYGTATADMPLPWDNASAIHLPLMMEKTETLVPMLMSAYWGVNPVVSVERSPAEYMEEQTDNVEQFMNFVMEKDIPQMYETFENWMRDTCLDGMSTLKPYWLKTHRMVSELHQLKAAYEAEEPDTSGQPIADARFKIAMELLTEVFGLPSATNGLLLAQPREEYSEDHVVGTIWDVAFIENRQQYQAEASFLPSQYVDEVTLRVRRSIVDRDSVQVDVLEYEDCIMPFRSKDPQTADRVTQKYWLTVDEVEEKVATGEWNLAEADMAVIKGSAKRKDDESHTSPQLQKQKDGVTGEDHSHSSEKRLELPTEFASYNRNKVMIFLVHLRDDVDGKGIREEVIYHIPYCLRKIVRADYLDEVYGHGRRPFITAKYMPISNRSYAIGMGDQLAAINLEINAIINFINNNQELITNPFWFYEPTAFNSDTEALKGIRPGQGIPVMSVAGIFFPTFPVSSLSNMEMLTSLLMFADRLTISPLNAGSSQMKNAPRTARGTMALLGEGHVKIDMMIIRLQRGPWMELAEQIFGLYQNNCPDEKWYKITRGDESFRVRMTKEMLRGRYEFKFKGNTVNTNREVLRNLAQVRYSTIMTHPDYATDPNVRRAAIKDFLKFHGDGADIDRLVPALPGQGAYEHPPMSQKDENKVIEMSVPIQVLPTDNHPVHLQDMDRYEKTQQFQTMPEAAVAFWAQHKLQHQQQLQAQAVAQNFPVGPGQANNVPQGATLDGGGRQDSNVQEGGNNR